jgi:vitamin B12 transport system substrate-binding protein
MKNIVKKIILLALISLSFASLAENTLASATTHKPSIIALSPHIVEMLYDIGAGEQIIGTTTFADYPEQAKEIPIVGNYLRLQIEKFITLQPDYIIAWKSGNPSDDITRLEQLGFKIIYSQPNSFEDIAKEMREFGQLTGHEEKANVQAEKLLSQLNMIKAQYQNKTPITIFYELWSKPLTTVAKGSWPQQFLNICQANNPFEQVDIAYPQVNIEKVLQAPIQLIIQPLSANQSAKVGFNWQDWPIIPAVKNEQIIQPNADSMHRMTMRSLTALSKLCADIDKSRSFYQANISDKAFE